MLYELIGIARVGAMQETRDIVRTVGSVIIRTGGVVRRADWLGRQFLPKIITKNQEKHFAGHHFYMQFDSSMKVQHDVAELLRNDPRMIRCMVLNIGKTLPDLAQTAKKPNMV